MSGYHKAVLAVICLVLFGSVGARAWYSSQASDPAARSSAGASDLTDPQGFFPTGGSAPGASAGEPAEPDPIQDALPAVTEGSFFALIGFALGYTTKKIFKVGLILVALIFVAIQLLVHFDVVDVDWNALVASLNDWVMNLREDGTVQQLLTDRIPSAGGLAGGYLLGFRKG